MINIFERNNNKTGKTEILNVMKKLRLDSNIDSKSSNLYFIEHHRNIQINIKYLNIIKSENLVKTSN